MSNLASGLSWQMSMCRSLHWRRARSYIECLEDTTTIARTFFLSGQRWLAAGQRYLGNFGAQPIGRGDCQEKK